MSFECDICHKEFMKRNALGAHTKFKHTKKTDAATVKCPECGRECKGTLGLNRHMRLKHDPKTNAVISENSRRMWADKETHDRIVSGIRKAYESDDVRRKVSEATSIALSNPETRAKLSEASKGMWERPEYREKMRPYMDRIQHDPEMRERHSEAMREHWADQEYRERVVKSMTEAANTPERRESRSRASKEVWRKGGRRELQSSPEMREKISNGIRDFWNGVDDDYRSSFSEMRSRVSKETNARPDVKFKLSEAMHRRYEAMTDDEFEKYINSTKTSKHSFVKNRSGNDVYCASSYESRLCNLMLSDPDVADFDRAGFSVMCDEVPHRYIPDFRVTRRDGTVDIVETKSTYFRDSDPMVPFEIAACTKYCEENGMRYVFMTEHELDEYELSLKGEMNG